MKRIFLLTITIFTLISISACSTMQPPRYYSAADNIYALKKYQGEKIYVANLNQSVEFSSNCRLMGSIEPADGLTLPEFITKAFNDEFKLANLYSKQGNTLNGDITKVEFSSITNLTSGYWDLGLSLKSSNGRSILVSNKYKFKSGFDAITACNATADALTPAVQDLIKKAILHPEFGNLLK